MKDAFLIAATLDLQGNADKALARIVANFSKAGKQADFLQENLKKLDAVLDALSPGFTKLSEALKSSTASMRGMNNSFTTFNARLEASGYRMDTAIGKAEKLKVAMAGLGEAVTASNAMMMLSSGVAAGRSGKHGGVHAKGAHIGPLGFSAPTIGAAIAGYAIYEGYNESKIYQQILSQVMLQNIPGANAGQINNFIGSQNIPGVSQIDLLQKLQDALVVSKNIKESESIAPFLAKIGYANKALYKGTNQELGHNDFYAMVKGAELITGSMDVDKLKPVIDEMVKINSATSGQVKPTEWLQFLQKTRGTIRGADPRVMYQLEPLIQEYRGAAVGVMVRAFYQHLDAGRLTTAAAMQLDKMGLVKKDHIEYNKIGMLKRILPGGVIDQKLRDSDLVDWYNKYFMSYFKKNNMSLEQEKMINSIIFTNSDLAMVNGFAQQQDKIEKTAALNAKAAGVDQTVAQASGLATGKEQNLLAAYSNFKKAIGDLTAQPVLDGLNVLANLFNTLAKGISAFDTFMHTSHPTVNKIASLFDSQDSTPQLGKSKPHINTIPPSSSQSTQVHTSIQMDGKIIAQAVSTHQGYETQRWQQTSTSQPDMNHSLASSNYNPRHF